jgi:hypothetical protein
VYTQVCEPWLCSSYARLHDPTVSSPFDDNELVMQCYAMNVSRALRTLPLVKVGYSGYAKYITRTRLVTLGYGRGYAA